MPLYCFCSGSSEIAFALCQAPCPPCRGWARLDLLRDLLCRLSETRGMYFTCSDILHNSLVGKEKKAGLIFNWNLHHVLL